MSRFLEQREVVFSAVAVSVTLAVLLVMQASRVSLGQDQAPLQDYPYTELSVEIARAALRLAEAELFEAVQQNKQFPNSVSEYDLARRGLHVQFARQSLSDAEKGLDQSQQLIGYMKLRSRLADFDVDSTEELRSEHPELVSDARIEKMRSYAELCRLRLEIHSEPINQLQLLDHLHWETHRLSEEILLLNRRIDNLEEVSIR